METINIRLDCPVRGTPTGRLKAALAWAHSLINVSPFVERVELRRDTEHQVLVLRFRQPLQFVHGQELIDRTGVRSITVCGIDDTPYSWEPGVGFRGLEEGETFYRI